MSLLGGFLIDSYVALERSTIKSTVTDVKNFLQQYPNHLSIYESWQRLDAYMQVQKNSFRCLH